MTGEEVYIIGNSPIPIWCKKRLAPYRRADGKTGWEFWGARKCYSLQKGDLLILQSEKIRVKKFR